MKERNGLQLSKDFVRDKEGTTTHRDTVLMTTVHRQHLRYHTKYISMCMAAFVYIGSHRTTIRADKRRPGLLQYNEVSFCRFDTRSRANIKYCTRDLKYCRSFRSRSDIERTK